LLEESDDQDGVEGNFDAAVEASGELDGVALSRERAIRNA
jgi:hypothetical protein